MRGKSHFVTQVIFESDLLRGESDTQGEADIQVIETHNLTTGYDEDALLNVLTFYVDHNPPRSLSSRPDQKRV